MYDYFKAGEQEQYQFLQLPWMLIKDEQFRKLSDGAKILYSLLLNRTSLSAKNGWIDEEDNIYIVFTIEEITEELCCATEKATKIMTELKNIGLLKSVRRGLGKPNILYVMNFATSLKYQSKSPIESLIFGNRNSRVSEIEIQEFRKSKSSNINYSNKDIIKTDNKSESKSLSGEKIKEKNDTDDDSDITTNKETILSENKKAPAAKSKNVKQAEAPKYNLDAHRKYERIIKDNIDYSHYAQYERDDIALIDGLVENMLDVILTETPATVRIGKEDKNRDIVKNIYLKLDSSHIDHVLSQYKAQRHQITHKNAYLKTMLYTVYSEFDAYFTNQARADGAIF